MIKTALSHDQQHFRHGTHTHCQVMQRNRERKLAQIAGLRQPEPYLEPVPVAPPQPKLLAALPYQPEGGATGEGGVAPGEQEHGAVKPGPKSPYASLGEVEPVNLTSFAYQIASGMVSSMCAVKL